MESAVVSDHLKLLLADRSVKAAVFTTYNFEPDFFELEVVPLLLPGNTQLSSHPQVKLFQVREALRESAVMLEIFYDLGIFRKSANCSPSMEYPFHGIYRGNNAFHPKLAFILINDEEAGGDRLLVGAGSNNLTQAGWWDNIECIHWETVQPWNTATVFLERLKADVQWLQAARYLTENNERSALDLVAEYLDECLNSDGPEAKEAISYFGIASSNADQGFDGFIRNEIKRKLSSCNDWNLEIISPYFAADAHNELHMPFFELGVRNIQLLLPKNQNGLPVCTREYFNHINEQSTVQWAEWNEPMAHALGLAGGYFRHLHAKVYHFYNKMESWVFAGSVNFTYKAFTENIEAGYFVRLPEAGAWLTVIEDVDVIDHFEPPCEVAPGDDVDASAETLPVIDLVYNWRTQSLTGVTEPHKNYSISIGMPEGGVAVSDWSISGRPRQFDGDMIRLEQLLKNGSLVQVGGYNRRSGAVFESHWVMMKQTGWSHKPLELPQMSPEQILTIYAGMSPDKRQNLLMSAYVEKLVLSGEGGDMTSPVDEFVGDQFFSEYAELFHSFRQLKRRLTEEQAADNVALVDYYLTGTGVDSLPILIDRILGGEAGTSHVKSYLILLCVKEIYQAPAFLKCFGVTEKLSQMDKSIAELKHSGAIRLENDTPEKRVNFFHWFEDQFFKTYRQQERM